MATEDYLNDLSSEQVDQDFPEFVKRDMEMPPTLEVPTANMSSKKYHCRTCGIGLDDCFIGTQCDKCFDTHFTSRKPAMPEVKHYNLMEIRPFLKTMDARLTRSRYATTSIREYLGQIQPVELAEKYLEFYDAHPFFQEVCAGAKHHHWWKGGLEDHVREMIGLGMDLMDLYPGDITFTKTDLIIVAFLHDFDKVWTYKYITPEDRTKYPKKYKEKQVFNFVEGANNILDGYSLKLLELSRHGISPTNEQWSAVLFHEGGYSAANFDYEGRTRTGDTVMSCNHLAPFMHMLDIYSAMILGRSLV